MLKIDLNCCKNSPTKTPFQITIADDELVGWYCGLDDLLLIPLFGVNQLVTVVSLSVPDQHSISSGSELDQHLISFFTCTYHESSDQHWIWISQPDFVQLAISLLKSPRVIWSEEHHYH